MSKMYIYEVYVVGAFFKNINWFYLVDFSCNVVSMDECFALKMFWIFGSLFALLMLSIVLYIPNSATSPFIYPFSSSIGGLRDPSV